MGPASSPSFASEYRSRAADGSARLLQLWQLNNYRVDVIAALGGVEGILERMSGLLSLGPALPTDIFSLFVRLDTLFKATACVKYLVLLASGSLASPPTLSPILR